MTDPELAIPSYPVDASDDAVLSRPACPECGGTRTLDGITDEASAAAWLDCTTCSAMPKTEADRG
jgi:hypothetical protein